MRRHGHDIEIGSCGCPEIAFCMNCRTVDIQKGRSSFIDIEIPAVDTITEDCAVCDCFHLPGNFEIRVGVNLITAAVDFQLSVSVDHNRRGVSVFTADAEERIDRNSAVVVIRVKVGICD